MKRDKVAKESNKISSMIHPLITTCVPKVLTEGGISGEDF